MPDDDLLTTTEAAAILHRSTRTILRKVDDGELVPFRRLGEGPNAAYLFRRSDVERLRESA